MTLLSLATYSFQISSWAEPFVYAILVDQKKCKPNHKLVNELYEAGHQLFCNGRVYRTNLAPKTACLSIDRLTTDKEVCVFNNTYNLVCRVGDVYVRQETSSTGEPLSLDSEVQDVISLDKHVGITDFDCPTEKYVTKTFIHEDGTVSMHLSHRDMIFHPHRRWAFERVTLASHPVECVAWCGYMVCVTIENKIVIMHHDLQATSTIDCSEHGVVEQIGMIHDLVVVLIGESLFALGVMAGELGLLVSGVLRVSHFKNTGLKK